MAKVNPPPNAHRYDAFISYSHQEIWLAQRLSRRIRRYRPPSGLGLARKRLVPFRDVEQLTASGDLSDTLVERLGASKFLIVLCSPAAAQSHYVREEIACFLERRDPSFILVVLCSGEPETSIPEILGQAQDEPLFVDLRKAQHGLSGYRRFRAESLRILAALYQVDYSRLAREDERRKRRRQAVGSVAAFLFFTFLAAMYLILAVEPYAWADQRLPRNGREIPDLTYPNPLLPIRQIAFKKDDPKVHLYLVRDAEYHGQKPRDSVFLEVAEFELPTEDFEERAIRWLEQQRNPMADPMPFARLQFKVTEEWTEQIWSLGSSVFFLTRGESNASPSIHQILAIQRESENPAPISRFIVAPAVFGWHFSPVDNWPSEKLRQADLLPRSGMIRGVFENLMDGSATPAEFRVTDSMELFKDAIGPLRFDTLLASNTPELEVNYDGYPSLLSDLQGETQLWEELLSSGEWVVYFPPHRNRVVIPGLRPGKEQEWREEIARNQPQLDAGIARNLVDSKIAQMEGRWLRFVSRDTSAGLVRVVTLLGLNPHPIASSAGSDFVRRVILFDGTRDPDWRSISLPTSRLDSAPTDLIALDGEARQLLLVMEGEGLFFSSDFGSSWEDFNLGERRLATSGNIQVIPVGNPSLVYVLVDNDLKGDGSRENFLFQLNHRNWITRLRIALADWLMPPTSEE